MGETPEERFHFFCELLKDSDVQQSFWDDYPVLRKQVNTTLTIWLKSSCEFVQRLTADWDEIQSIFSQNRLIGKLERVKLGDGDLHNDGRTVAILTFTSGLRLVYKPRSVSVDVTFQQLLAWLSK